MIRLSLPNYSTEMNTEMNAEPFDQQFTQAKHHTSKYIHSNKIRRHRDNRQRFYCSYEQQHICPVDDVVDIQHTDFFKNHISGRKSQNDHKHTLKRTTRPSVGEENIYQSPKSSKYRSMNALLLRRKYCKHFRCKKPRFDNSNQRKYQLLDQKKRQSAKLRKHQSIRQQRKKHSSSTWPNYNNTILQNMPISNPFEEASHIEDLLEKIFEYQQRITTQQERICSLETLLSMTTTKRLSYKTIMVRDILILIFFVWILYL